MRNKIHFCWMFLYILIWQIHNHTVQSTWPISNISTLNLLGLFPDAENTSTPTLLSVHSRAMFKAAIRLSQLYNMTIDGKYFGWQTIQTGGNAINCLREICEILPNSNIVGIVGPAYSREADIIAAYAGNINLPIISYSATSPDLSDRDLYKTFFRTVSSDNATAWAMVNLFLQYNWTSCIVIYQNDAFGTGGVKLLYESFGNYGLTVDQVILFNIATLTIQGDLKSMLLESSTRIVILWAGSTYTNVILQKAIDADVIGPQFLWILTNSDTLEVFNKTVQQKLIGMFFVEPVIASLANASINTTLLDAAYKLWQQYEPETFPGINMINYFAYFAFDAAWTLIKSLENYCSTMTINGSHSCLSKTNSSFCFDQQFDYGNDLVHKISTIEFHGISGQIKFSMNVTDRMSDIFYVAKNIQSITTGIVGVPVLILSESGSWQSYTSTNVIIWPGNTLTPPTGIASISGVLLRIGVALIDPYTMIQTTTNDLGINQTQIIGYMPDLINLLVDQMGFIAQIIVAPSNCSYNGLIDDVANGIYDIFVADVTITSTRSEKVSFSNSIFDNSLRVIVRQKTAETADLTAFLRPLSIQLWMVILAAMISAGILIYLFERHHNEALQDRSIIGSIAMSMWYSFGNLVGYGVDFHVRTAAGRLITVGLYTLSLVIIATYTANLTSDLTTSKTVNIISGIDDIKNGKIPFSRIGIVVNTSIEAYYLRTISNGIQNFYPLAIAEDIYPKLMANIIDAAIMDAGVLEYVTSSIYCNLTLVGTDVDQSTFGIVMQKNWIYAKNFDYTVLSLRESGTLDTIRRKWFERSGCSNSDDTSTSTTIESTSGLFVTFAVIVILSICLYVWETCYLQIDNLFRIVYRMNILRKKNVAVITHSNTDPPNCCIKM